MRNHLLLGFLLLILLSSCKGGEPNQPYIYESNPHYTSGYTKFYGAYYSELKNPNNVLSVSLFTDSLYINDKGSLAGVGQYLFLEDVFISASDTLLAEGTYTASVSGEPFTFSPGLNLTVDEKSYTLGTTINYYEENSTLSTVKLITDGSFTVSYQGDKFNIECDFIVDDSIKLKGSFTGKLPPLNELLKNSQLHLRKKVMFSRK